MYLPEYYFLAVASLFCCMSLSLGQSTDASDDTNGGWIYDIPPAEAAALAGIVEDEAPDSPPFSTFKKDNLSPQYDLVYRVALPIPPIKEPTMILSNPMTGKDIYYYEIEIKPFRRYIYPNLEPAEFIGYDGMAPGPTFLVPRGTESIVRFINHGENANSVHLHGSYSRAPFDGWAEDVTEKREFKDYYYPNMQSARSLWYHDHAVSKTAENAYAGQAGAYIITDAAEDALNLPSGYGVYDIPLVLSAKQYQDDGRLFSLENEDDSLWGDIIQVNDQPWPFLNVEPRKYRFRLLNAAVSRSFALYWVATANVNTPLPFQVIASDTGLLEKPVQVSNVYLSNGERYEVVFDFAPYAGKAIELRNYASAGGIGVEDDYQDTDKVMRFLVGRDPVPDPSTVPTTLRRVPYPTSSTPTTINHHFRFHRSNSEWRINDVGFADANNRVLAAVPRGTVEIWELENSSDGWTHPVHVHLVDFRVLERRGGRGVLPYEAAGLKDVVWLGKEETAVVEAHYAPWDGVYMFHCHNLIHEDQDMMAAFNVTALTDFGYNETTRYMDPMEARWRAKKFDEDEWAARTGPFSDEAIRAMVDEYTAANPYSDVEQIGKALDDYWTVTQSTVVSDKKRADVDTQEAEAEAEVEVSSCSREEQIVGPMPRYRRMVI